MKSKYFLRYQFIIEKLQRSKEANFQEMKEYVIDKFEMAGYDLDYSLRTFQRDKKDIRNIFDIYIDFDRSEKCYYINENDISETAKVLLDAFTVSNALQVHDNLKNYISFEEANLGNPGIFYELSDAIKNKNRIQLYYQKYYSETHNEYTLEPLALKEFRQRWYLIANKVNDKNIRTFGLDRILSIETQKAKFKNNDFNLENLFSNFYGIITDKNTEFTEVVLSFDSFQGNYIKSLPLHHSQRIIKDTKEELIIKLKLHMTFDFMQKLLSYGSYMTVILPESLKNEIKNEFIEALEHYK